MCLPQFHVPMTIIYTHEDGSKDVFLRKEELGRGGFAVVYRVIHQSTGKEYAMKVLSKEKYEGPKGKKKLEKLKNEILIQKSLNHPNIVRSYYAFTDAFNYYIVLEYCPGKTVRDLLKNSEKGYLSEPETRKILRDVIRGLVYLHDNHIIHRDLKLENYMIGSDGKVKIADFGLSVILKNEDDKRYSICGTPNYLSPELLQRVNKGHSYEVDIWTIGVSAFAMLTGHPPFEGGRKKITYENIKNCDYHFPPYISISPLAKDFIRTILRINPQKRPTAIDLANHPFLTTFDPEPVPPFLVENKNENDNGNQYQYQDDVETPKYQPSPNVNFNFRSNTPRPHPNIPLPTNVQTHLKTHNEQNNEEEEYQRIVNKYLHNNHHNHVNHYDLYHYNNNNHYHHLQHKFGPNENNIKKENELKVEKVEELKEFTIPKHFVSRFCFYHDDLGYLLSDGTVGACFKDRSRIVMDPKEEFIQYYKIYDSPAEVINVQDYLEKEQEKINDSHIDKIKRKIYLVRRFAKSLKKTSSLYELPEEDYDPSLPLHHVKYFLNKDKAILFRLNDKDLQVNFVDHKKLIIFWNTKQMCLVRSITQKCSLMDLNDVVNLNSNNDELKRFMVAKEMLAELCRK